MNPLRRKSSIAPVDLPEDEQSSSGAGGKGRPTPKRRTRSAPPAPAPRTRKEAAAWQKRQRKAGGARKSNLSSAQYREAIKAGDPRVLPRRDQGPVRALARDYVDTHRMISNYLLVLFALFIIGYIVPVVEYVTILVFIVIFAEWFIVGGRIRKLALARGLTVKEGAMTVGFYAGSRAYFPRSWRRPIPLLKIGDKI